MLLSKSVSIVGLFENIVFFLLFKVISNPFKEYPFGDSKVVLPFVLKILSISL